MDYRGTHVIIDVINCDFDRLNDGQFLEDTLSEGALSAGCTILHKWTHQFEPQGVTAFVGLSESHISIHTIPEQRKGWLDIFTCGDRAKPEKAVDYILQKLSPKEHSSLTLTRH